MATPTPSAPKIAAIMDPTSEAVLSPLPSRAEAAFELEERTPVVLDAREDLGSAESVAEVEDVERVMRLALSAIWPPPERKVGVPKAYLR